MSKFDDAIENYKKSISINSQESSIFYNLGLCYKSTTNYDNAIIIFKKAIEINKKFVDAYYELGETLFMKQSFDEAKIIFEALLKIKPDYARKDKIDSMISVTAQ